MTCSNCATEKDRTEFYPDPRRKSGYRSRCKACHKLGIKKPNAEKRLTYKRRYAEKKSGRPVVPAAERAVIAAAKRADRLAAAEQRSLACKVRPPERGTKAWYSTANTDEIEAYRAYHRSKFHSRYARQANAERLRTRVYKLANPAKVVQWNGLRAARASAQSDGTLTRNVLRQMFADADACPYCDRILVPQNKAFDHVSPLSRGGLHGISNVLICCRSCNSRKSAKPIERWLGEISRTSFALPIR